MSILGELQRRNVFRVAVAYLAAAWLIVQIAETLVPVFDLPGIFVRWIAILLGIGIVPMLVFAWAWEITPEGLKRERDVDRAVSITAQTGRRLDGLIMVVLAVAVAYFLLDKFVFDPGRDERALQHATETAVREALENAAQKTPAHYSIAVLPFIDLSPSGDREYFADGIAEEVLNLLTRISEIRVVARTSSFSFKGKSVPVATIAQALNVTHVLEGSVRSDGDRLRITVQLIEASTGYHLWSENYDRKPEGIFQVQDDVARNVVSNLKLQLTGKYPTSEVTDPEAYRLFMLARDHSRKQTREDLERAIELLEQAVAIDPGYATAWSQMAIDVGNATANGLIPWKEGYDRAIAAAQKSIEVDPDHAMGYSTLGTFAIKYVGDLSQAAAYYERSLELEPANPVIRRNAALLSLVLGRHVEAAELSEYASQLNPLSGQLIEGAGLAWTFADRLDEAESSFRRLLELSPEFIGARYHLGKTLLLKGEPQAALDAFEQEPDEEYQTKGRCIAQYALGNQVESDAALAELIERWGEQWPSEIAQAYAFRGEIDAAFEWLEREVEMNGTAGWGEGRWMRFYDNLKGDPRWQDLLVRANVSDEQLASVDFRIPALP